MFDHTFIKTLPVHAGTRSTNAPLTGLLVLDFTHYIAGPLASMLLADLGATVVKIEGPGGDRFRAYPPHDEANPEEGAAYLWANRNKLGIEIDLKHPEGRKLISHLVRRADVLIENFATGVMDRLGLGYASMSAEQPALVYCSISAYGSRGDMANRPGFDSVVQAESGFVSMNGYPDRPGVRTGSSVMDIGTALLASNGILSALYERNLSGKGRRVEVSLYGSALMMAGYATMQTLCSAKSVSRQGNTSADSCPTGVFECRDASFFLHCGSSEIFKRLMTNVLSRQDVADAPCYQSAQGRLKNRDQLFAVLKQEFSRFSWQQLKLLLERAKVPAGEVRDLKSALLSQETQAAELVERIEHPTLGWVPNVRSPISFDGATGAPAKAAPVRGQDTLRVLTEIAQYDEEATAAALASGALHAADPSAATDSE
ncbi:CoA transferase [Verticiella sediminum]|uniref:CoA transferase n=2 Tax=Verticiella sediminum TaxID=1247510 RepID=A0A556AV85_9BURK|nr:CoA transferase [Verticiella sediminum]